MAAKGKSRIRTRKKRGGRPLFAPGQPCAQQKKKVGRKTDHCGCTLSPENRAAYRALKCGQLPGKTKIAVSAQPRQVQQTGDSQRGGHSPAGRGKYAIAVPHRRAGKEPQMIDGAFPKKVPAARQQGKYRCRDSAADRGEPPQDRDRRYAARTVSAPARPPAARKYPLTIRKKGNRKPAPAPVSARSPHRGQRTGQGRGVVHHGQNHRRHPEPIQGGHSARGHTGCLPVGHNPAAGVVPGKSAAAPLRAAASDSRSTRLTATVRPFSSRQVRECSASSSRYSSRTEIVLLHIAGMGGPPT